MLRGISIRWNPKRDWLHNLLLQLYLKIVSNTLFVKVHMLQYFVMLNITCYKAVQRIQKNEIHLSHLNQYLKIAFMQSSHDQWFAYKYKVFLKLMCHLSKWLAFRDWETFFVKKLNYWLFFCLLGTKISYPFLAVMQAMWIIW